MGSVNGDKITREQLISTLIDWQSPMVLDELLTYYVVGQEARKADVVVTVDDVKAKLEEQKSQVPPGQDWSEMLKRMGYTPEHAFARVKMMLQAEGVLRKSIEVTNEDLDKYRSAKHILIRLPYGGPDENAADKEKEAKEKIEKIAQEIKDGKSFEEAAKEYSEDPSSKAKGGDLGYFVQNQMPPEFGEKAFSMKVGEISEPVKTMQGYHLIELTGIGSQAKGEDREKLEDQIIQTQLGQKFSEWMLQIKNQAKIENFLEPQTAEDPAATSAPQVKTDAPVAPDAMPPPPPPAPPAAE